MKNSTKHKKSVPKHIDGVWTGFLRFMAPQRQFIPAIASIAAIITGLLFGLVTMLIVNAPNAWPAFMTILRAAFIFDRSIGQIIHTSVPLIMTGLSVAFAFRTGLFNIGATGQFTVGAFAAIYVGVHWGFLGSYQWMVAILMAVLAGGLWGSIPGILKAYRNVHEVVTSIMLNYVAMYLVILLIKRTVFYPDHSETLAIDRTAWIPQRIMPELFNSRFLNMPELFNYRFLNISIFIVIAVVAVVHIVLNRTTFGYELQSVGFNRHAAKYAGMNEKRNMILSMMIAGMIAGAGGAMKYLVRGVPMSISATLLSEGFTGIAVALLGLSSPIGVFLAGVFYGYLRVGGSYLQSFDFTREIIDIIIAVIIYFSALSLFLQRFVARYIQNKTEEEIDVQEGVDLK